MVTGSHSQAEYARYADAAREFSLYASRGSDFHAPGESRTDLGSLPPLPGALTPVWEAAPILLGTALPDDVERHFAQHHVARSVAAERVDEISEAAVQIAGPRFRQSDVHVDADIPIAATLPQEG